MMRINRISLVNFRGVTSAEVIFPAQGVTIVEGDNEVGKSSLAEALQLVLSARDDSKKSAVKSVQPVGRDVGPEVTVDLTCGPYRFVYTKRWLRKPQTLLDIVEPSRSQLTGREAHERVEAILAEHVDMGLWDALRLQQGQLDQADYATTSLGRALDIAAGGDRAGDREDDLWTQILAEKDKYWTPTGKPARIRTELEERVTESEATVKEVEAELRDLDSQADEVARLHADAQRLTTTQQQLEEDARELNARHERVTELTRHVERLRVSRDAEVANHDKWASLAEARAGLIGDLAQQIDSLDRHRRDLDDGAPTRLAARTRRTEAAQERDLVAGRLRTTEEAHDLAVADTDFRRWEIELAQLLERRNRVVEVQEQLSAAEETLETNRITPSDVEDLESAHLDVATAQAAASSGAATVTATAIDSVQITVDGAGVSLAAGETLDIGVAESTEVLVPNVVRFTVSAGAEAQELSRRLEMARATLERRCAALGVADLAEARLRAHERSDAERVRRDATARIQADLRDLTVDSLTHKTDRLQERIAEHGLRRPETPPLPADLDAAQELSGLLSEELRRVRAELVERETDLESARAACTAAENSELRQATVVELDEQRLANAEALLAEARSRHDDLELTTRHAEAMQRRDAAEQDLAESVERLTREDPETLEALVGNASDAKDRGALALAENRDRRRELEAVLKDRGEQGLAHRRDQACTERDRLRGERDRLEARADAALLLHDTFAARRSEARSRYVAPFRERIEALGRLVFGSDLSVALDADLKIESRTLAGQTVPFEHLSTGAREQLGIISRLACASIVAADGGAPVLLDDALGWTDPGRLSQMGAAIGVASRSCQVIVLTCTPGRYAGVGAATTVRLTPGGEPTEDGADTESKAVSA